MAGAMDPSFVGGYGGNSTAALVEDGLALLPVGIESTARILRGALDLVPQPVVLAGAAYVSACSAAAGFVSRPLRPLSSLSFGTRSSPPRQQEMTCAMHGCSVRMRGGRSINVPLAPDMTLQQVQETVTLASGLTPDQQKIYVFEERGDLHQSGLTSLARATLHSLQHRPSAKATLVGWVNFFFLPEVINREWAGRGLLAWAHSNLLLPLQRRSAHPAIAASSIPVTVQSLAGASASMEFESLAIVADLHVAVRYRYGLSLDRQSLVIAERPPANVLVRGADSMLTRGVRSLRVACEFASATKALVGSELEALNAFGTRRYASQTVQSAVSRLKGEGEPNITMRLQTPGGGRVLLSVPQATSIGQVAALAQECRGNGMDPIHLVLTPPRGPPPGMPSSLPPGGIASPLPPKTTPLQHSSTPPQGAATAAAADAAATAAATSSAGKGAAAAAAEQTTPLRASLYSWSTAATKPAMPPNTCSEPDEGILAKKLAAQMDAAAEEAEAEQVVKPPSPAADGKRGGSLKLLLSPTKLLGRALSGRVSLVSS